MMRLKGCGSVGILCVLSYLPVTFILGIIVSVYTTAVCSIMAELNSEEHTHGYGKLLLFHVVFVSTVVNFLLSVFVDPGRVPPSWRAELVPADTQEDDWLDELTYDRSTVVDDEGVVQGRVKRSRYCAPCKVWKPERCHHCRSCGRCVLKMDHHCVFINNCVGFVNQKFFILFIVSGLFGCMFAMVHGAAMFMALITGPPSVENQQLKTFGNTFPFSPHVLYFIFTLGWILSLTMSLTLSIFSCFHIYLLVRNQTTLETWIPQSKSFSLGTLKNIRSVLGASAWTWLLPLRISVPGNGVDFSVAGYEEV
eukprot:Plantae.Rhodophyta-Purpureofilum_apyrenoidigerum.ctg4560.p1 GENE.Plantae.Rhodophyta-Purpureofilum_apyrenoidigerum.ctg4560~~Plantae.Rhodophyta-Purpureofilum_apyrenoidigerum.ctg4560.p1  ORF type:complete len:309 (+),score=42.82 Plantae.Rhodophyta-Purpureofilum_apyrenoidigerum.ctg4560:85-1011(+)